MIPILLAFLTVSVFSHPIDPIPGTSEPIPDEEGPQSSNGCDQYFTCLTNSEISSRYINYAKIVFLTESTVKDDIVLVETCYKLHSTCDLGARHLQILENIHNVKTATSAFIGDRELRNCLSSLGNHLSVCVSQWLGSDKNKQHLYYDCLAQKSIESQYCTEEDTEKIQKYGGRIANGLPYFDIAVETIGQAGL